jgi:hypothetical protein
MAIKYLLTVVMTLAISASYADVLIEDFNDAYTGQTTLGQSLGTAAHSGYWYGFNDVKDKGTSTITPNVISVDSQFAQAVVAGGPDGSKCLHVTMNLALTTALAYPYAAIGYDISTTTHPWINLTAMTGFTFMAKGAGTVRVKFLTNKVTNGYPAGSNWGDMGAEFTLTAAWTKYTIAVANIQPQPSSPQATAGLTWAACRDSVNKMHFQTAPSMLGGATLDLYLDSLVMQGVTLQTFGGVSPVICRAPVRNSPSSLIFSCGNEVTISLPSKEMVAADLYSLNGSLVQKVFRGSMQKATFTLPVQSGNYIAVLSVDGRALATPLKIMR